jgi:uncharacterized membrane protein YgaE (UPF0421/DUF939 family)
VSKYQFFELEEMKTDEPEFFGSDELTIENSEPQTQINKIFSEYINTLKPNEFEEHQPSLIKLLENKPIAGIPIEDLKRVEHDLFVSDSFYCKDDIQQLSGINEFVTDRLVPEIPLFQSISMKSLISKYLPSLELKILTKLEIYLPTFWYSDEIYQIRKQLNNAEISTCHISHGIVLLSITYS